MRHVLLIALMGIAPLGLAQEMDKDEAGIWMVVEKQEQFLRTSPARIQDEDLDRFLHDLSCALVPSQCSEIRIYVLRVPGLNAFMMPNGAMFIQSGLLLRMTSTSELASVIAHEIVHFSNRHTIDNIRRWHRTSNSFAVLGAVVGAAGSIATAGATSYESYQSALDLSNTAVAMLQAAQLFSAFQLIAYQREDEQESDTIGLDLLTNAGFNPHAAPRVWENYLLEESYAGKEKAFSVLSTHPLPTARMEYLRERAQVKNDELTATPPFDDDRIFQIVTNERRKEWLESEVRALHPRQFEGLIVNQKKFTDLGDGYLYFSLARAWQLRAERQGISKRGIEEAQNESLEAFTEALNSESGMPTEGYRGMAKLAEDMGETAVAIEALTKYLVMAPDAWDAKFVKRKIERLSQ